MAPAIGVSRVPVMRLHATACVADAGIERCLGGAGAGRARRLGGRHAGRLSLVAAGLDSGVLDALRAAPASTSELAPRTATATRRSRRPGDISAGPGVRRRARPARRPVRLPGHGRPGGCLIYTSDAADEEDSV